MKKERPEKNNPWKPSLRAAGLKATPGRLALLELLDRCGKPMGITRVLEGLKAMRASMDKATVYRNLAALEKKGLIRRVDLRHGHADYELAAADDHHHLVCTGCGRLEDFGQCDLKSLERKALKQSRDFARINQHSLEFFGLCNKCASKKT